MNTYKTRQECYNALLTLLTDRGYTTPQMVIPNSGSTHDVDVPEGYNAMGLEGRLITINDNGNTVVRTNIFYGAFKDYAGWF